MKSVIPAAGFGTRMLPAAKAVPKELLPVLDKPTIEYVVAEAVAAQTAGASTTDPADVLLITSRDKRAIEDHFDRAPELEERLAATAKHALLRSVTALRDKARIHSVRQGEALGLGHAVLQARQHVGADPFLCLLGDTLFSGDELPARQLTRVWTALGGAQRHISIIGLERVPKEKLGRYGVVAATPLSGGASDPKSGDEVVRITGLVEKPAPGEAPSDLAIAARYLLMPAIFDHLAHAAPGKGGEIQLTDALQALAAAGTLYGVVLSARRHDIGSPEGWLATNLHFARRDPAMWAALAPTLREISSDPKNT